MEKLLNKLRLEYIIMLGERDMIEIKNVTKKYGDNIALNNVSFNVNDGEIFAFIGHNGAGKTTLIKSIVGIHDFDERRNFNKWKIYKNKSNGV